MSMGIKDILRNKPVADCEHDDKCNKSLVSYGTSSDSDNESKWDFDFLDSDFDELMEGKRLTTLVRRSYMRHLHQTLNDNYKIWARDSTLGADSSSATAIALCAAELEKKALRACMMANIYQKTMVHLMHEVRKSTKVCQLHIELGLQVNPKERKWHNKESQTETCVQNLTENSVPPSKTVLTTRKVSSKKNTKKVITPSVELTKDTVSKISPLQKDCILNSVKPLLDILSDSPKLDVTIPSKESLCSEKPSCKMNWFNIKRKNASSKENLGGSARVKKMCTEKVKSSLDTTPIMHKDLEERLLKLTNLFGDSETSQDGTTSTAIATAESHIEWDYAKMKLPIFNWHMESIAQVCNINRILTNMSQDRRARLEKRFKDLFGGDNEPVSNVTPMEMTYCRKRIAEMVVTELTPFYIACRIGSKHIFKELAKKITNNILKYTYAPDFNEVKKHVNIIFQNGKCITNLNDLSAS